MQTDGMLLDSASLERSQCMGPNDLCSNVTRILFLSPEPHKSNNPLRDFCVKQARSTEKPTSLPVGFI